MTGALAVDVKAPCWLFQGYVHPSTGYGHLTDKGVRVLAHRYMWTVMRGPIPEGMTIDHLCRVRRCVNPQHTGTTEQA